MLLLTGDFPDQLCAHIGPSLHSVTMHALSLMVSWLRFLLLAGLGTLGGQGETLPGWVTP